MGENNFFAENWFKAMKTHGLSGVAAVLLADQNMIIIQDTFGRTVAHELCLCKLPGAFELFLRITDLRPACLSLTDKDGFLPIHMAAQEGNGPFFRAALHRYPVGAVHRSRFGRTPLHFAAQQGHLEICGLILDLCPESPRLCSDDGRYPIHLAAFSGNEKVVTLLMDSYPESVRLESSDGRYTPLFIAAEHGHKGVFEILLRAFPGAALTHDMSGRAPIETAIVRGHTGIVETLIDSYPLTARTKNTILGRLPLHNAILAHNLRAVELLISAYPSGLVEKDFEGYYPIHMAAQMATAQIPTIVMKALPETLYARATNGRTAMHFAAQAGSLEFVNACIAEYVKMLNDTDVSSTNSSVFGVESSSSYPSYSSSSLSSSPHHSSSSSTSHLSSSSRLSDNEITEKHIQEMMSVLSVRSTDEYEVTAAHLAASKGHAEVLKSFLHSSNIKAHAKAENYSLHSNRNTRNTRNTFNAGDNENTAKNENSENNENNEKNENIENIENIENNENNGNNGITETMKIHNLSLVSGRVLASVRSALDWLPLHSLAQGEDPFNEACYRDLLSFYPEGAAAKDRDGNTPLGIFRRRMLFSSQQMMGMKEGDDGEGGEKGEAGEKGEENKHNTNEEKNRKDLKDLKDSKILNKLKLLNRQNVISRLLLLSVPSQDVAALKEMNWDNRKIMLLITATGMIINRKNNHNCDINTLHNIDIINNDISIQSNIDDAKSNGTGKNESEEINEITKKTETLFEIPNRLEKNVFPASSIFSIFLAGECYFENLSEENLKVVLDPEKNIFSCLWWHSPDVWKYLISFL